MDALVQFIMGDATTLTTEVMIRIAFFFALIEMLTRIIVAFTKVGNRI